MKKTKWIRHGPVLKPFQAAIEAQNKRILEAAEKITGSGPEDLATCVNNHLYYGLHKCADGSW